MAKQRQHAPAQQARDSGGQKGASHTQTRGNSAAQADLASGSKAGSGNALKDKLKGTPSPLPYRREMEEMFGVDLGDVTAWMGQAEEMERRGADAAASGRTVAFKDTNPSKDQVAREVAHLVQEQKFGPGAAGQSSVSDSSEYESREAGRSLGTAVDIQQAPSAEVQLDPSDTWQEARRRAYEIKDALLDHWTEDEEKALRQIRGQSTLMLREIRAQYRSITGHVLENDFREYCNSRQYREALGILWRGLSLYDQVRSNVDPGWLWDSADEQGILDTLRNASRAQLDEAAGDRRMLNLLRNNLNDDEYYEARKVLQPDNLYPVVLERIRGAESWWNDDENAVYNVLLDLTPAQRRQIWTQDNDAFGFLSGSERASVRRMCMGTEAEALEERMELATDGWGTDDEGAQLAVERAGAANQEQQQLQGMLNAGALSPEQRAAAEARLGELGAVDEMLTPQRNDDGELTSGFLADLHGDVGEDEFQSYAGSMGVDPFQVAKQRILDSVGFWNDDEEAINRAFESLSGGDPALRQRLWDDPQVQQALTHLNREERSVAQDFATGSAYDIALQHLADAYYGMDTDEERLFRVLTGMSEEHRQQLLNDRPPIWRTLMASGWLSGDEKEMLRTAAQTGRIPTDIALNWAFGGNWDGTEDEMVTQTLEALTPAERATYRLGYWLQKEGRQPADEHQRNALRQFEQLFERMDGELGDDDLQSAMDALIGLPSPEELTTEEGRLMAAGILHHRQQDKLSLGSGLADAFTDADETRDQAAVAFDAQYTAAMADGTISEDELAVLAALDANFAKRYQDHVQAVDFIRNIAGMVAAVAVGILVTVLTGGTAGPAVGSLLAQYGAAALAGGVAGAVARVGTSELMAGDHYDTFSTEGAVDAAAGFADGATAVLSAGLAARFSNMVGLSRGALAGEMAAGAIESTGGALSYAGRNFAGGALRGTIEGFLSGVVGEVVLTAADGQVWRQSVWDVVCNMGLAILRGGTIGAATGGLVGGPAEALSSFVEARRIPGLLDDLAAQGLSRADLESMPMDVVQAIGRVDNALSAGQVDDAERILARLGGQIGPDEVAKIRRALGTANDLVPEEYLARVQQLANEGAFGQTMYHGSNSDMLDGLADTDGSILSAEDLHQRNVTQATGEGDAFSGRAGRKNFISVGEGEAGLGTSLAYAEAGGASAHYNVQVYTFQELDDEIRRLQTIVDNWSGIDDQIGGPMGQMFGKEKGQFESQLAKLRAEMDLRLDLPETHPRRLGGPDNIQNYPVLFEFDATDLRYRGRSDVQPGGMLGGEGSIYDPIDLRQRLVRAYAPMDQLDDLRTRLSGILGHEDFELIPLEAMQNTPAVTQQTQAATRDGLGQLEQYFQASQRAYEEAARDGGGTVTVMDAFRHMNDLQK